MPNLRFIIQNGIKAISHSLGLEVRYAFQNPSIADPKLYQRWFKSTDATCIFDVGANVGQSAQKFANNFPNAAIHSFEPFPATFQELENVASKSNGHIKAYQMACGDTDERITVAVPQGSTSQLNSINRSRQTKPQQQTMQMEIKPIDSLCAELGIDRIDLLKTDTEGFDTKVLDGAMNMLSTGKIRCVVSEVGFLEDKQHTPFNDVYKSLSQVGFKLAGLYEVTYLPGGGCDFANALFVASTSGSTL